MRRAIRWAGGISAAIAVIGWGIAFGQPPVRGSGGWGPGASYTRLYDTSTVQTMTGQIMAITRVPPRKGMHEGLHLAVMTTADTVSVHLGPAWYLDRQDIQLALKDVVEVRGSMITFEGEPALIAARVARGGDVLVLRDESGLPAWAAWRRR